MIDRDLVIKKLAEELKNDNSVQAMWLEGADANELVDKYSDLDIWIDVKDGTEKKIIKKVQTILELMGELDLVSDKKNTHPKILEYVFHLKNSSPFLLIEVGIQLNSRNFNFIEEFAHEQPKVIFDKKGVIKFSKLNKEEWEKEVSNDIYDIRDIFRQQSRVKVKRKNFLEVYDSYLKWTIEPLIKMLRIKFCPFKKDYGFKHLDRDLPKNIVKKIKSLLIIKNVDDIARKQIIVQKWFSKLDEK